MGSITKIEQELMRERAKCFVQHCLHCSEVEMRKKTISLPTHSDMAILSKNAWQMLAKVIRVTVSHIANEGSG